MPQDSAPGMDTAPAHDEGAVTLSTQNAPPSEAPPVNGVEEAPSTNDTPANADQPGGSDFVIPEAYKDKPWASKVKSADDLWKQLDNTQNLVGRKQVALDFENATPQEIETYLASTRPESTDAYVFKTSEDYVETGVEGEFAKMLHGAGISAYQGNKLIQQYQALESAQREQMFDADKFLESMEKSFGNGYEAKVNQTRELIEANLNDNQKARLENVPNQYLTLIYELASNINKAYGASETGKAGASAPGFVASQPVEEVRKDLRQQISALTTRPHDSSEKQKLVDALAATYKTQGAK